MENLNGITNKEILDGSFRLTFDEICEVPESAKRVVDIDHRFRLHFDPDGLDVTEIVCTTSKHRIRFKNCVLRFPLYPTKIEAMEQKISERRTYRCTSLNAIPTKYWLLWKTSQILQTQKSSTARSCWYLMSPALFLNKRRGWIAQRLGFILIQKALTSGKSSAQPA